MNEIRALVGRARQLMTHKRWAISGEVSDLFPQLVNALDSVLQTADTLDVPGDGAPIEFEYTNHKGRTARRRVMPLHLFYGATEWHPQPQWFLYAVDLDKHAHRSFPLGSIVHSGAVAGASSDVLITQGLE